MTVELSIVICTRNRANRLGGTLASLAALHSVRSWEVLLVDNASTDDTTAVLAASDDLGGRKRVLFAEPIGLGAARDMAWRQAKGTHITFTDDDCYLQPDFVDAVLTVFDERPRLACLGGRIMLFDPSDVRVTIDERDTASTLPPRSFVRAGTLHGANMTFTRDALETIGGIDPELGAGTRFPCEDIDAIAATVWAGLEVAFDPRPVVFHHHGRKVADLPKLRQGYDLGRGVYYAKYLRRPDARLIYLRAWWSIIKNNEEAWSQESLRTEFAGAITYLMHKRDYKTIVILIPFIAFVKIRNIIKRHSSE